MASAASRIQLESPEESLISALDAFAKYLREKEQRQVELRIAGGWVRDKVNLSPFFSSTAEHHLTEKVCMCSS